MPELQDLPRASIEAINGVGGQLRVAAAGAHRSGVSTIDVLQIGCPPLNASLGLRLNRQARGRATNQRPLGGESLDLLAARLLEVDESRRPDAEKEIDMRI